MILKFLCKAVHKHEDGRFQVRLETDGGDASGEVEWATMEVGYNAGVTSMFEEGGEYEIDIDPFEDEPDGSEEAEVQEPEPVE